MENNIEKEIDLVVVFKLLIKNIKMILIGIFVFSIIGFMVSSFFIAPKYISSVSLYVTNGNMDNADKTVNINDINVSQKLVNTYIVIINDDEVLSQVAEKLLKEFSVEELEEIIPVAEENGKPVIRTAAIRNLLKMSSVNNTEVLKIEAETKDAEFSAKLCDLVAETAPASITRIVKAGSVEVIGTPTVAYEKSSPSIRNYTLIGFVIGFFACVAFVFVRYLLDNTVKGEEDIKEKFDIPVLGEIPDFACFKEKK